jgi:hypothetical protein
MESIGRGVNPAGIRIHRNRESHGTTDEISAGIKTGYGLAAIQK